MDGCPILGTIGGILIKIGLFTDSHYSSAEITCNKRYNNQSLRKIQEAYAAFRAEGCDLVICLGDLIDKEPSHEEEIRHLEQIAEFLRRSSLPTICVMGNHDGFAFSVEEFYSILGKECQPRSIHRQDLHLLFADACYFRDGNHYQPGKGNWKDTFFPHTDELARELEELQGDVYLFMHQNIDPEIPENHRLFNDKELRQLLERSGTVKAVYQGHYHPGHQCAEQGIRYVTLSAMCERENGWDVIEL